MNSNFQDPKWSLRGAIESQVAKEDLLNWARRPLEHPKVANPTVEFKTSPTGLYAFRRGIYKETRRWIV